MKYFSDEQESNGKQKRTINIFLCYVYKDKKFVDELDKQLRILQKNLNIKWTAREVTGHREWVEIFDKRISTADIILPLISTDFLASNYLDSSDMQMAFDRQQKQNVQIIPIHIHPANHTDYALIEELKGLPENNKPVSNWRNKHEAFLDISLGIKSAIKAMQLYDRKEETSKNDNIAADQVDNNKINNDDFWNTDLSEIILAENMQVKDREIEVISPSIDRSSYLSDLSNEKPKKKKNKKSASDKTNKVSLGPPGQLPLFPDPSQGLSQRSNENLIDDYEYLRSQAQYKLTNDQPQKALDILENVDIGSAPSQQRWRLSALRGHCYFGLGKFLPARNEYLEALQEKPIIVPKEQTLEEGILYFKAAETDRELGNLTEAAEFYRRALAHRNTQTQLGYLADVHWGLALVLFEQIHLDAIYPSDLNHEQKRLLEEAFDHARDARHLYHLSGDAINAASITCDIALFEQATGDLTNASKHLNNVIDEWIPMIQHRLGNTKEDRRRVREYNNIISAASCYLARIETEQKKYQEAERHVQMAEQTAKKSYLIRQVEAAITHGIILEARDLSDHRVEEALQKAIDIASASDLLGAQIHAHDLLGRHFLKIGEVHKGNDELDQARKISQQAMFSR